MTGATGPQGLTGATGPQGTPGLIWRGVWTDIILYNTNDVIYYNGSSYICLVPNINVAPPNELDITWGLVALKGADGLNGTDSTSTTTEIITNTNLTTYGNFYGLSPNDYPSQINLNEFIPFANNQILVGDLVRSNLSSFNLVNPGTYQVQYQISVREACTIILNLNIPSLGTSLDLPHTLTRKNSQDSYINGSFLIQTNTPNNILSVKNISDPINIRITTNGETTACNLIIIKI